MDAVFLTTVEVGQYFMTQDTEEFSQSQMQWLVVSILFQEMKKHLNRKVGSEGTLKFGPYWKLQLVACMVNMELRSKLCL